MSAPTPVDVVFPAAVAPVDDKDMAKNLQKDYQNTGNDYQIMEMIVDPVNLHRFSVLSFHARKEKGGWEEP